MATSNTRPAESSGQTTLAQYGTLDYELGDLLIDRSTGSSRKLILSECPLCASDPNRPRYHFGRMESRPDHFEAEHTAAEIP